MAQMAQIAPGGASVLSTFCLDQPRINSAGLPPKGAHPGSLAGAG